MRGLMPPPEDHWELLQMMVTYTSRLWTMYGLKCDNCRKVFYIYQLLEDPVIETNRNNFTPILCQRITWEIIDDSHQFFSGPLHPNNFLDGKIPKFKSSLLYYVILQVCFQTSSDHPLLPMEWRQTTMPIMTPSIGRRDGGRPVPVPPPNNLQ